MATDSPHPAVESEEAGPEAKDSVFETTDTALSVATGGAEPAPTEAVADTAEVTSAEAVEETDQWDTALIEEPEMEPVWFSDLDEALAAPEIQWTDTPSATAAVIGEDDVVEDHGEGELTPPETDVDEPLQREALSIAEEPAEASMAETSPQATAEAEPSISGSVIAHAQDLVSELRSLLPEIAGHRATLAEAFRSAGVDPNEVLERIDALNDRTDTAAIQRVANAAAHADGHERDIRELEALMAERGVIEELAQTVLDQQLILDDLTAVLQSARER